MISFVFLLCLFKCSTVLVGNMFVLNLIGRVSSLVIMVCSLVYLSSISEENDNLSFEQRSK